MTWCLGLTGLRIRGNKNESKDPGNDKPAGRCFRCFRLDWGTERIGKVLCCRAKRETA